VSLLRALYTRAAGTKPVSAMRAHPRIRAFARRHLNLLLARGRTWTNVDSALRLLAEDRRQKVAFGPWRGDPLLDVLYWQPFVRWAQTHFGFAPDGTTDAVTFPPEPVMALVEEYRQGTAPPRPLLKRMRHAHVPADDAGGVVPWSPEALRGVLAGAPTISILPEHGAVEPDLDLALRVAAELGESLTVISRDHLTRLLQAVHGPGAELEWGSSP
jgi:hypothetical protein